jgi:nicotinamide-nucleotide amidase
MNNFASETKRLMDVLRLQLCVAESITTGNIQAALGSVSGCSTYFEGGMTVYSLKQKGEHLAVDREHAIEVNCVSERVADEMARGVCLKYFCDIGIGTTGYAEPYLESNRSTPHAYVSIWRRDHSLSSGEVVARRYITGDGLGRIEMQRHVTEQALSSLVEYLKRL